MYQHTHVQNHVYTNKSRLTNLHDACQLLNPALGSDITHTDFMLL